MLNFLGFFMSLSFFQTSAFILISYKQIYYSRLKITVKSLWLPPLQSGLISSLP